MKEIEKILKNTLFLECIQKINDLEKERIFCCHGIEHLLAVARIGYLYLLEHHIPIEKELFYATALLHDIGKWQQYQEGIPHETASASWSKRILKQTNFSQKEQETILSAIQTHRTYGTEHKDNSLNYVLWYADKHSRNCFLCSANAQCNWTSTEKNTTIFR